MTKEKVIPQVRFSGFTDTWEQREVSNVAMISTGGTPSTAINEYWNPKQVPWLSSGEVHKKYITYTDDKISNEGLNHSSARMIKQNSVLIALAGQGKTRGTVAINRISLSTNQSIAAMTFAPDICPEFVFSNLESRYDELRKVSSGDGTRGGLNKQLVSEIQIPYTSLNEQRKIGQFFTHLDRLITLHQRKYDKLTKVKKAMLEKMFPENGSPYPEIRFKGFTDAWEQRKLSDMVERVTRKNENRESELPLTISAQYGLIDQNEFFDKRIASRDVSGYYLLKKGEFAYNKSTSSDAPWGAVKRLDRYEMGVLSTLYIVFALKENGNIDSNFLVSYYDTDCWHKGVQAIAAEGARNHGLLNITPADYFETVLTVPSDVKEQHQIGSFFAKLDTLITLHQRKLEKLKNIKKACLEKMFV
jgi:type I restriction enzyme S subunit